MASALDIRIPAALQFLTGNFTLSNFALDQSTDALETTFKAREAATITRLGFRYGVRTGTPPTYRISLQGVDASGNPDGTVKGGGSPASVTFTPPADATWNGTFRWLNLANSYTCTRGEDLAWVIDYSSGTVDGSNNSSFTAHFNAEGSGSGFPVDIQNNATVRSRQSSRPPVFGYGSAGTAYGYPVQALYTTNINSSTTPDEVAMAFSLPSGWCSTYKIAGARMNFRGVASGSIKVILYSGTTVLQTVNFDTDWGANVASDRVFEFPFEDATLATLNAGSTYRIGFQPQGGSGNYTLFGFTCASAADLTAFGGGQNFYLSTRTDAGAWTDDLASRPFMDLLLDDITGGGAVPNRGIYTGGRL